MAISKSLNILFEQCEVPPQGWGYIRDLIMDLNLTEDCFALWAIVAAESEK